MGLATPGLRPETVSRYGVTDFAEFQDAVLTFLQDNGNPSLSGAAFSTSGWEVDGQVDLVHYGFSLNRAELRSLLGVNRVNIVNEFVAKALALPGLNADEHVKICGGTSLPEQVMVILGPTVGFGGALLVPDGMGRWTASHCEGGHSDFAACNLQEVEILKILMAKFGHVSRERALSFQGLVEIWEALCLLNGDEIVPLTADELVARAYANDTQALQAIKILTEILAGTASDYALITGARGGVYLTGELLDLLGDLFDSEVFAARFHDKGRVSTYVRDIPVFRVVAEDVEVTLFE